MLEELKKEVLNANLELVKNSLVLLTWGNVSQIDREKGLIVIKPSGVSYSGMSAGDMSVVDLDGNLIEGKKPSSDTATHLVLYKAFKNIGGITHTHSTFATAFAQAGKCITAYGTTHADAFYGDIPCTRALTKEEIESAYEYYTGKVICEIFDEEKAEQIPAVTVKNHGVFTWGENAFKSVENAIICEEVAKMAYLSQTLNQSIERVDGFLMDKHYFRKHGSNAAYGQN